MDNYVERMINEFPMKRRKSDTALTPTGNNIFGKDNRNRLGKKETEELLPSAARRIFVAKRARQDIHQTAVVFTIRIK